MSKTKWLVLAIFVILSTISYAVDDQYKPYLHKAAVPEHPKAKLYGSYSTNIFPGAATYSYPLEVPKGTNGLSPSISISYNSQSMKQRPSVLGSGWSISLNYIYRDVNFTLYNATDDEFKLILNGASYDLVYDFSDGVYHTEIETFSRIDNLSDYWQVTLKDGTLLRFGYNSNSRLSSNTGKSYNLKWNLDQIQDTHGNKIFYSYLEDPYAEDNGTSYLYQIVYNNDFLRKVEFSYESPVRSDLRFVYDQGNKLIESRRLDNVYVFYNSTLVRRYDFDYVSLNNESVSSLDRIRYIGSDNSSLLHTLSFGYYSTTSDYYTSLNYNLSVLFSDDAGVDFGVRLVDLNNDGFIDVVQGRNATSEKRFWLNNKTAWNETRSLSLPEYFVDGLGNDKGVRFIDLNNDGFSDIIQGWSGIKRAWIFNISHWDEQSVIWQPPIDFVTTNVDQGVQLVDFNGDGLTDIVKAKDGVTASFYLNTGNGWRDVSALWSIPANFVLSNGTDKGLRFVELNGDGLVDLLQGFNFGTETKNAWLNNGSGWVLRNEFRPPDVFTSSSRADNGIRLIDLNGDGLTDLFQDYSNETQNLQSNAYINTGNGWVNTTYWKSPESFTKAGKNVNRRIADVNGDGFGDIILGHNNGTDVRVTVARNFTIPYLLKNITNEFGGVTYIDYSTSTSFDNTGGDNISDIGFNVFVVNEVLLNNSLLNEFSVLSNTSYSYFGGRYDYNDSEFRGFSSVNETMFDSSVLHYFKQDKVLKGKEFRTEIYDSSGNLVSKNENEFNFTSRNNEFIVNLLSSLSYLYDGNLFYPKVTGSSYRYDNYSNLVSKVAFGDFDVNGDEKYENYSYALNTTSWILDKPTWYVLFDSNFNKLKETKYFYDDKEYGSLLKGDLTKVENWLDTGFGNPTTRFRYDGYGNLIESVDPLGRVTKTEFGLTDSTFTYPERIVNALGHKTDYTYDLFGNILTETKNGITKYSQYDMFGRISKEILPYDTSDLPTKTYSYSFDGVAPEKITIKQKTTSNNTLDVSYYYDGNGNLVQTKSPFESSYQVVNSMFYDSNSRISQVQTPFGITFSDNLSIGTKNLSNLTKYTYDALGRVVRVTNPDGTTKNTNYSQWEINDFDENSNKHTYHLDAYGRIVSVTEYNTDFYLGDNQTYNTTYSYDGRDELTGIRDVYGHEFNFSYDSLGRKISVDDPDLGIWVYTYDLAGNLIKQANSKNTAYSSYDSLNRILQKNTSSQIISYSYDVQYQGTVRNITYLASISGFSNHSIVYEYDQRLRPIKEIIYEGGDTETTTYTYDSADRILEGLQPGGKELDYFYNLQGKNFKIKGYVNSTNYNPIGDPLNRTYFNGKVSTFDYNPLSLRLKQIKTDTIQILNYSHDNVGNIVSINDQANNRLYSMSYDRLDRLTNVTIGGYKWVYHYDPIGNVQKIVRNFSETTSMKYDSDLLPHAPYKIITSPTGVDIYRQGTLNTSNRSRIVEFFVVNERNSSLTNVNWTSAWGDGNSITSNSFNLSLGENVLVIVEHNYSTGGNYLINITGRDSNSSTDYERVKLLFGAIARGLEVLRQNASNVVTEFTAKNDLGLLSQNWNWTCTNGVTSNIKFNMSAYEELLVVMEHNYSLSNPNLSCSIYSGDGNQSKSKLLTFTGIKVENYNSTLTDVDTVLVRFTVTNYFSTVSNIKWNISANGNFYNGSISSLNQLQSSSVSQEINFSVGGRKEVKLSIGVGNFTDTYTEFYYIKWLDLNQFFSTVKNATTRIFDFIVTNRGTSNTWSNFSVSEPALNYNVSLANNESLIVVIEEDFSQGDKSVNIKIFNRTLQEDTLVEVFKIRHIAIDSLQTLHESTRKSVVSAIVENNRAPMSVSWRLNNSEQLINSTQAVSLDNSEQMIVVIESNFTDTGVYPLLFIVNSSTYNDNQTGVAIT